MKLPITPLTCGDPPISVDLGLVWDVTSAGTLWMSGLGPWALLLPDIAKVDAALRGREGSQHNHRGAPGWILTIGAPAPMPSVTPALASRSCLVKEGSAGLVNQPGPSSPILFQGEAHP